MKKHSPSNFSSLNNSDCYLISLPYDRNDGFSPQQEKKGTWPPEKKRFTEINALVPGIKPTIFNT